MLADYALVIGDRESVVGRGTEAGSPGRDAVRAMSATRGRVTHICVRFDNCSRWHHRHHSTIQRWSTATSTRLGTGWSTCPESEPVGDGGKSPASVRSRSLISDDCRRCTF